MISRSHNDSSLPPGRVYLIGAGPGDPGLITLRGRDCLALADLVLYDYLVNPQILEHCSPSADLVCLGRHGEGRIMPQDEINRRLIEAAIAGKIVARLKGGDPAVFARAAEETADLRAAGVDFEIVPGVTAALAAGGYAGISITDRDVASGVALITGHESPSKDGPVLDYEALARFPGTLVIYMGVTTAHNWSAALIAAGKPADTPAAIIRRCSWPDQQTHRCRLDQVAAVLADSKLRPPAVVIVGRVAGEVEPESWFTGRPLFGQTILVTRPLQQARELRERLAELGARVLIQPAIEIDDPPDWRPVDAAIGRLADYDWIVFSSANGVRQFLDRIPQVGTDLRILGGVRIAAIGPATAETLAEYRLTADRIPGAYRAEELAGMLAPHASRRRFLLVRASRGREVLADELTAAGGVVDQVVAYTSRDVQAADAAVASEMRAGRIQWTTVTSSAIARSLAAMFGEDLSCTRLASISPLTSSVLTDRGYAIAAEAAEYTTEGLIAAMVGSS